MKTWKKGDRVRLKPVRGLLNVGEEYGTVIDKSGRGVYMVELDLRHRDGPTDDGLREVDTAQMAAPRKADEYNVKEELQKRLKTFKIPKENALAPYPELLLMGIYCVEDSGGATIRPAKVFNTTAWQAGLLKNAGVAAKRALRVLSVADLEILLMGEFTMQKKLLRKIPWLKTSGLDQAIGAIFDGSLSGAWVTVRLAR